MTCKDCYHYDACNAWINYVETLYSDYTYSTEDCPFYKDKSRIVELPCKVGDSVCEIEKNCLGCLHYTDGGYSDWCECTLDDSKLMFECDFDKECLYHIIPKKFTYGMIEQFGKSVFLTRELAEEALRKEQENHVHE